MIKVLIVDDQEIVRRGLKMTIELEEDMTVAGEATNGEDAIKTAGLINPDVVLLDVQMPVMDGIIAAKEIHLAQPDLPILMLTNYSQDEQLYAALQSQVSGYLLKDISGDDLTAAIRGAVKGEPQLHPEISRKLMRQMKPPSDPLAVLTEREKDVLRLIAQGLSNKEIGQKLFLTEITVKGYVSDILGKLMVSDRTQAALFAIRHGLVKLEELP